MKSRSPDPVLRTKVTVNDVLHERSGATVGFFDPGRSRIEVVFVNLCDLNKGLEISLRPFLFEDRNDQCI